MTRQEVKQELRELTSLTILSKVGIDVTDEKGLKEKYEQAISKFDHIDQEILRAILQNNQSELSKNIKLKKDKEGLLWWLSGK